MLKAQTLNASSREREVETERKDEKEKGLKLWSQMQSESVQPQSLVFSLLFEGGEDL